VTTSIIITLETNSEVFRDLPNRKQSVKLDVEAEPFMVILDYFYTEKTK